MYREDWYYPAGVRPSDFIDDVVCNCEACGADIVRNEPVVILDCDCYCNRCATEASPTEGDRCEICGATDSNLYEVDGEYVCEEHLIFETAGEEY